VCCAVGLANVKIMEDEDLPARAERVGKRLLGGLEELRNLPNVGEVRGLGMMAAVELVTDKATKEPALGIGPKVAREAMARGILLRPRAGSLDPAIGDTICLAPPLMTPEATIDRIVEVVRESLIAATA
jgi:adenosylmethionine-8-amino-7-oxononanoate aminotransferase